jgi:hypothetical protein
LHQDVPITNAKSVKEFLLNNEGVFWLCIINNKAHFSSHFVRISEGRSHGRNEGSGPPSPAFFRTNFVILSKLKRSWGGAPFIYDIKYTKSVVVTTPPPPPPPPPPTAFVWDRLRPWNQNLQRYSTWKQIVMYVFIMFLAFLVSTTSEGSSHLWKWDRNTSNFQFYTVSWHSLSKQMY